MRNDSGYEAWLGYKAIEDGGQRSLWRTYCGHIRYHVMQKASSGTEVERTAIEELGIGLRKLLGINAEIGEFSGDAGTIRTSVPTDRDWFEIHADDDGDRGRVISLIADTPQALLYSVFRLLTLIQLSPSPEKLSIRESPANRIRMINHWDNMDGSIERGYAGGSLFFKNGKVLRNLRRIGDYARLLASTGINAIAINNVNVHVRETGLITEELLPDVARIASIFRKWGITLYLSVNYAAPITLEELDTADPLDSQVAAWWQKRAALIYSHIPDFGGFLVKADSEGRPGPFSYGRNHADGANMLAKALAPYGGTVFWRCFVYNCRQNWRDRSIDRARAAYDHFMPLDGAFLDNVVLQIKNGPMDFQVREPISPLFGGMKNTNQALEFQIAQEYTGQQRHLCFLPAQWREYLDFETVDGDRGSRLAQIASGKCNNRPTGGITAVVNVGTDLNWTGHDLAQANLYGFGRLCWDSDLSADTIAKEWCRLTIGQDSTTNRTISAILSGSWKCYENYTAPLGVGWMVNPSHHYGPNVDGYEYDRWGTYHFADRNGIGVDRTVKTGTGYTGQYLKDNAAGFESLSTCPDELLLFFHHVPYTHKLHSGKTVIQHIYDTHFEGVEQTVATRDLWKRLQEQLNLCPQFYSRVLAKLEEQVAHAIEWRDIINTYFLRKSGIEDQKGREIFR